METFTFANIDTDEEQSIDKFVHALAAEGFNNSPGNIGTRIDPVYNLIGSELVRETIGNISYVI